MPTIPKTTVAMALAAMLFVLSVGTAAGGHNPKTKDYTVATTIQGNADAAPQEIVDGSAHCRNGEPCWTSFLNGLGGYLFDLSDGTTTRTVRIQGVTFSSSGARVYFASIQSPNEQFATGPIAATAMAVGGGCGFGFIVDLQEPASGSFPVYRTGKKGQTLSAVGSVTIVGEPADMTFTC